MQEAVAIVHQGYGLVVVEVTVRGVPAVVEAPGDVAAD
jgi:hypothetical protein